jgi:hypothetical protein
MVWRATLNTRCGCLRKPDKMRCGENPGKRGENAELMLGPVLFEVDICSVHIDSPKVRL